MNRYREKKKAKEAGDMYRDFLYRAKLLSQKLLSQGYVQPLLKSSLQKFYG
jgi:hypothetical protein